ncbi:hypothetical protein CDD83_3967 [Cordyceps sp. RAO-2017]|nr:hypothetical protein CDD83_3967 [Cordyceps sp. RAO-2017]
MALSRSERSKVFLTASLDHDNVAAAPSKTPNIAKIGPKRRVSATAGSRSRGSTSADRRPQRREFLVRETSLAWPPGILTLGFPCRRWLPPTWTTFWTRRGASTPAYARTAADSTSSVTHALASLSAVGAAATIYTSERSGGALVAYVEPKQDSFKCKGPVAGELLAWIYIWRWLSIDFTTWDEAKQQNSPADREAHRVLFNLKTAIAISPTLSLQDSDGLDGEEKQEIRKTIAGRGKHRQERHGRLMHATRLTLQQGPGSAKPWPR